MQRNFIKRIRFFQDFRCFEKKFEIEFREGINLLVGEQGTGKSSLFYSILNWQESGIGMDYDKDKGYLFFDTETMNPRRDDAFKANRDFNSVTDYENAQLSHAIDKFIGDHKSHGQAILPLILSTKDVKGKTIMIDEPESGLSIRSQYAMIEHYKKLAEHNQLIIATHSPLFIKEVKMVYSMEHRKWMINHKFLISQLNPQIPVKKRTRVKRCDSKK